MSADVMERTLIDQLVPELQAEGYEVVRDPRREVLPRFLGSYSPDLIALRGDGNLAIEIATRSDASRTRLENVASLFSGRDDWKLKIYWASGEETRPKRQSLANISGAISQVKALIAERQLRAAYLFAWATFEALGRNMLAEKFARPQTPGRLIEVLANEGTLTPSEADQLRAHVETRNRLVHGELDTRLSARQANELLALLEKLERFASQSN